MYGRVEYCYYWTEKAGTFQMASQRWPPAVSTPGCPLRLSITNPGDWAENNLAESKLARMHVLNPSNGGQNWKRGQSSRADIIGFKWIQNFKTRNSKARKSPENFLLQFLLLIEFCCWFPFTKAINSYERNGKIHRSKKKKVKSICNSTHTKKIKHLRPYPSRPFLMQICASIFI